MIANQRSMKSVIYLFIVLGFTTCKSVKTEGNTSFKVNGATYNYWVGGQAGVSGIRVIINYTSDEEVTFDKIYFQKKEGTIENYLRDGKTFLVGRISTSKKRGGDLTMDIDPKEEMNNKLPEKIPFELKENEAVIMYTYKGESHHYKITDIKKTQSDFYP